MTLNHDHDDFEAVENSEKNIQRGLNFFSEVDGPVPEELRWSLPRRITLSDDDLGGPFSVDELVAAYRQITQNGEKKTDRQYAAQLRELPLSLGALMYLIQAAMPKALVKPGSVHYFERVISNLWRRCDDAIINLLRDENLGQDPDRVFESMQGLVRAQVSLWVTG